MMVDPAMIVEYAVTIIWKRQEEFVSISWTDVTCLVITAIFLSSMKK